MKDAAARLVGHEILHDDPDDLRPEAADHLHDEVVGERSLAPDPGQARRDAVRLVLADPDRQQPLRVSLSEQDHVLPGEDVDPHGIDHARHEHRLRDYRLPAARRRGRMSRTSTIPATNPTRCAK